MKQKTKVIMGWVGVSISLVFSSLWAVWGTIENFHEGWFEPSLWANLGMFFFQYLLLTFVFMILALISLKWRIVGLILHVMIALGALWLFYGSSFNVLGVLIMIPILSLGLLYFFGNVPERIWAYRLLIIIPMIIIISISIPKLIQVSNRLTTQDFSMQTISGNGVELTWAPRGPGWPDGGISWNEAIERCLYLSEDGLTLMAEPQGLWRLPTIEEAVASMMLHGETVNGVWNSVLFEPSYDREPDKEAPLWDVYSPVIYYWLNDESTTNLNSAYIIVYHGGIYEKNKTNSSPSFSFRAVKN